MSHDRLMKKLLILPILLISACTTHRVNVDNHSVKYVTNYNTQVPGRSSEQVAYNPPVEYSQYTQKRTTIFEVPDDAADNLSAPAPVARVTPNVYQTPMAGRTPFPRNQQQAYGVPPAPQIYFYGY